MITFKINISSSIRLIIPDRVRVLIMVLLVPTFNIYYYYY